MRATSLCRSTSAPLRGRRHRSRWTQEQFETKYEPPAPGGLCIATYGKQQHSLVVSMPKVDGGFSGLLIEPVFDNLPHDDDGAIKILLYLVKMWSSARLAGPLAAARRGRVVERLKQQVFRILCGQYWTAGNSAPPSDWPGWARNLSPCASARDAARPGPGCCCSAIRKRVHEPVRSWWAVPFGLMVSVRREPARHGFGIRPQAEFSQDLDQRFVGRENHDATVDGLAAVHRVRGQRDRQLAIGP